jgi:hypothetical protein
MSASVSLQPLAWVSASVPKAGHQSSENEDAIAADAERMRFALADGATEGWQSGGWARHLAAACVARTPSPADFTDWLAAARKEWKPPPADTKPAWYTEVKQEEGSFATLLGLEFRRTSDRRGLAWKAVAVGDSCLFVVRGDRFETSFPLSAVAEFGQRPALVPSAPRPCPKPEWLAGRVELGDLFLLATDAVARHLLGEEQSSNGFGLVGNIREAVDSGQTQPLVESLTALNGVLNDDASVVAVTVRAILESTT